MAGNNETGGKMLVVGAAILGSYLFVIKPVLSLLGVDPEDKARLDEESEKDATDSVFSLHYAPFVDNFNANPSYLSNGEVMPMSDYYHIIKQWYDNDDPNLSGGFKKIASWSESIYDAFKFWNWTPHVDDVIAIMGQVETKQQVASMAAYFAYNFNKDLLHYLHYGQGILAGIPNGLTTGQMATLIKHINNLPES